MKTLPSSEAEAMMRSLKGFLCEGQPVSSSCRSAACDAPVGVQHRGSVASEERYLVGQLAALVHGNDSKCTATARLPIDRDVLGVDLRGDWVSATGLRCDSAGQNWKTGRSRTFTKLVSQALRLMWRLS